MTAEKCRTDEEIHKLAQGMLSEEAAAAALTHIESCTTCKARLTAAERNHNLIFTSLHHDKPAVAVKKSLPPDRSLLWEYRAAYGLGGIPSLQAIHDQPPAEVLAPARPKEKQ